MKVVYLPTARPDLAWFGRYYRTVFPAGRQNARRQIETAEQMLKRHPELGHRLEEGDLRELRIARTPFSLIYRRRGETIEVLRIWDGRADRADPF